LEIHLHGKEGPHDWDDTTSISIADLRLNQIRGELYKFDSLAKEEDRVKLKALMEALRRGDIPEVVPANH
jgi:hypothetical protein